MTEPYDTLYEIRERATAYLERGTAASSVVTLKVDLDEIARLAGGALASKPRCTCPVGFGQVVANDCPVHNPKPQHTISNTDGG